MLPSLCFSRSCKRAAGLRARHRILLGLLCADSGAAQLPGQDPWHDAVDLHRRLAHVPGAVGLWPGLTGGEAVDLLSRPRGGADRRRRDELIERFGLDPVKRCRACSKGNRQKAAIAAAPASDPELLLLDEPTAGLDPLMEVVPQDVIRRAKSAGRTVPFSSHVLAQAEKPADRVGIIRLGRRLRAGAVADGRGARLRTGAVGHRRGRLGPVRPAAPAARAVPVYASVTGYLGQLLRLPGLTRDLSPSGRVPQLPAAP